MMPVKKSLIRRKAPLILLPILLLGLLLRGLNSTFGSPSLYILNDEAIAHLSAFNMIVQKTPISLANYTPLGAYIQIPFLMISYFLMKISGLVNSVSDFELFVLTHEGYFLFIPRLLSGFFGTLTILVIYKLTFDLFGSKKAAIIAALFTAISFNLVHISHFGRPWAAALFFFILSVYLKLKGKNFLSFISVGLSYGFHQVGILVIPLIFWLTRKKLNPGNLASAILMILLIAILGSLTLRAGLIESIGRDQSFLKVGKFAADFLVGEADLIGSAVRSFSDNLSTYFVLNLLVTDGVLLFFGVWGIVKKFGALDSKRTLAFYVLFYFIFASLFFQPLIRYLLPPVLILIPFAAYGVEALFGKKNFLIIIVIIFASINSLWWNWLYLQEPTFISSRRWIENNVDWARWVGYTGNRYYSFVPSYESIIEIERVNPGSYKRLSSYHKGTASENVQNMVFLSDFPGHNKLEKLENALRHLPISYVVDYYLDPGERIYDLGKSNLEIVAHFSPLRNDLSVGIPEPLFDPSWNFPTNDARPKVSMYSLARIGPYIDILRVKNY